jgi:hypothetical protein
VSGQLHAPAALPRGKNPRYPFNRTIGGTQSRGRRSGEEKSLTSAENRTPAVQPLARHYTDWFILARLSYDIIIIIIIIIIIYRNLRFFFLVTGLRVTWPYGIAFIIFKSEFNSQRGQETLIFFTAARSAMRIIQPPIRPQQCSSGVKWTVREADHSPPSNTSGYTSRSPYVFMVKR